MTTGQMSYQRPCGVIRTADARSRRRVAHRPSKIRNGAEYFAPASIRSREPGAIARSRKWTDC
jgi:hypothetical protein